MSTVLAPSDLFALDPGARPNVGGRIRCLPGSRWQIADATHCVEVASDPPGGEGCLVVIEALWDGTVLRAASVLEVSSTPSVPPKESVRLLDRGVGRALRARARALQHVRQFFAQRDFLEVDTPQRVPSPGLDLHLDAYEADGAFLITSPEYQMKRLLVGGLPRIYQIVHCFRAGERGASHNSEFTMLEWYRAFAGVDDVMRDTEQLVEHVVKELTQGAVLDRGGRSCDVEAPFEQMTVVEAFERFAGLDADTTLRLAESEEEVYFRRMVEQVEPGLASLSRAVFLRDFPAVHASLARRRPDAPRLCERFELYVGGVELCNGFGELTDPKEQRARFDLDRAARKAAGKPVYPVDERFLDALEQGMPAAGGNALGLDRLIALCFGAKSLADVMTFPDEWL
ncbi:MAG: EF-P lysine aminoacylase EpmA, partial [Myxococcota bacterium]